ncbi:MAG: hypothetical protein KAS71_00205 [Bacteroidales bacterium]|nr:hypothetical protein [Bacteroidales bacterium]
MEVSHKITLIIAHFDFSNSYLRNIALQKSLSSIDDEIPIVLIRYVNPKYQYLPNRKNLTCIDLNEVGILWQRERFWNLALQYVDDECENVAWIDSDVYFIDDNWVQKAIKKLKSTNLIHLFNEVVDKQLINDEFVDTGLIRRSIMDNPLSYFHKNYFCNSGISLNLGCSPGFAWAGKTKIIKQCFFPDFLILGSGDKALLAAAFGKHEEYAEALKLNFSLILKYKNWATKFYEEIKGDVSCIHNTIYHLVQGDYGNRQYSNRYSLIESVAFEFDKLIELSKERTWVWKEENYFKERVNKYFINRQD